MIGLGSDNNFFIMSNEKALTIVILLDKYYLKDDSDHLYHIKIKDCMQVDPV